MSSSPYRRVTDEIENGNLAIVLATDIQYNSTLDIKVCISMSTPHNI